MGTVVDGASPVVVPAKWVRGGRMSRPSSYGERMKKKELKQRIAELEARVRDLEAANTILEAKLATERAGKWAYPDKPWWVPPFEITCETNTAKPITVDTWLMWHGVTPSLPLD